jgi:hypothetical protein
MSNKITCDGCGNDIPVWNAVTGSFVPKTSSDDAGIERSVALQYGNRKVSFDLCAPCFERAIEVVAAITPKSPREEYDGVLHGAPRAK